MRYRDVVVDGCYCLFRVGMNEDELRLPFTSANRQTAWVNQNETSVDRVGEYNRYCVSSSSVEVATQRTNLRFSCIFLHAGLAGINRDDFI